MKSNMETKDWLNDYESLKQVSPANPFTVPAGYFDDLGNRIVSLKNLEELKKNIPADDFAVPENYFEELSGNIRSRIAIEEILKAGETGFALPDGYFDTLSEQIQGRIIIEEAIGEPGEHFGIPDGYFETLGERIKSAIAIEEAVGEVAEPFGTPYGYFDSLHKKILDKTVNAEAESAKRRGIVRKLFTSTAFKYATAACFALAIGGGIFLTELSNPQDEHNNSFLHKQLSTVPIDDIRSYLQLNVDAGDTQTTVTTEGAPVNDENLKKALQQYVDSVQ